MTNLTQDHLDYHKTMEGYAKAKGILFAKTPRFVVLNRDDEWYDFYNNFDAGEEKITYGVHDGADVRINQVKLYKHGSEADVVFDLQTHLELATALPGQFNVYNECAASAAAYLFHVPLQAIVDGIANVESVPGRFEFVTKDTPYDVVVDYAHTPDALEKLLDAVKGIAKNRVILVFGACGDRDQGKRPIMGKIAAERADKIYVTEEESYSEDPQAIREMILTGIKNAGGLPKTQEIPDRREAIERALTVAKPGDVVLVTGMGHEQYRVVNGEQLPWNDSEVVREIVAGQADKAQKNRVTAVQSDTKDLA